MNVRTFYSRLLLAGIFISLLVIIAIGCKKDDKQVTPPPTAPVVTTAALTNISFNAATAGGSIVSDGGATITASGIVWSKTNATPTLEDSVVAGPTVTGTFTSELTGLEENSSYYIRAFATNSVGTAYGNVVTLNTTNDTNKVRFTYNGEEVVYGIIVSASTGRKWLDRNLGAKQVATAYDDYLGYGDLFQWGRPADGHQLMTWTSSSEGTPVNGYSSELATSDTPNHNNFIMPPVVEPYYFDWRSDNTSPRWATNHRGPCPSGWHVPSIDEWMAEVSTTKGGTAPEVTGITDQNSAYNQLKLTIAGFRFMEDVDKVTFTQAGRAGHYWSTTQQTNPDGVLKDTKFYIGTGNSGGFAKKGEEYISSACSVRCIKD
jgi:uncharacterized protein (TIGR02145 family)